MIERRWVIMGDAMIVLKAVTQRNVDCRCRCVWWHHRFEHRWPSNCCWKELIDGSVGLTMTRLFRKSAFLFWNFHMARFHLIGQLGLLHSLEWVSHKIENRSFRLPQFWLEWRIISLTYDCSPKIPQVCSCISSLHESRIFYRHERCTENVCSRRKSLKIRLNDK